MAIGVITDVAGLTRQQYETLHEQVTPGNQAPPGLLYHAAGPSATGWCVVEVWESQEAIDRFFQQHGATFQRAGAVAQPIFFEVSTIMQP